ncbi:DENN domain-containing protein 2A isoform X1 [Monodelphis domestica]|uniref:DENN domain containing 2A n=1 Tax=Monodelphis domestica TaxID=13616 RepID=F6TXA4_MONDO|nr:DENN domain-containing protein 2A isoform X1 [Monodelphis domestica]XP_056655770.1 DENN domain-containing protein 2A isoform X1 [Monodelphis domestica]XP_056655771.1 DENN domain-containing protein 2A isoform X1 [Monodelphis domestica]
MTASKTAETRSNSQTEKLNDKLVNKGKLASPKAAEELGRYFFKSSSNYSSLSISSHCGPFPGTDQDLTTRRSPLEPLNNLMLGPRLDCFPQNMLSPNMLISDPAVDLSSKESTRAMKRQGSVAQKPCPTSRVGARHNSLSIKDKISEWEGKKESAAPIIGKKEDGPGSPGECKASCVTEKVGRDGIHIKKVGVKNAPAQEPNSKENERNMGKINVRGQSTERRRQDPTEKDGDSIPASVREKLGKPKAQKDSLSVLRQVKKLEKVLKEGAADSHPQLPGTYYSPHCLPERADEGPPGGVCGSELSKRLIHLDLEVKEPTSETVEEVKGPCRRPWDQSLENVSKGSEMAPPKPFINPLPKPRRTFKHEGEADEEWSQTPSFRRDKRNLPPLPSLPPPPLPSSPPPSAVSRRLWNGRQKNNSDHRKSYEFEDLLQSSSENSRVDWYAQTKLALTRTLSEENIYEDILDPPLKENPYEDIELHGRCLGKKCVLNFPASPTSSIPDTPTKLASKPAFFRQNSERRNFKLLDMRKLSRDGTGSPSKISPPSTPSSPDDTFFNLENPQNGKRRKKIPKLVLRINAIYEARRGKKRVKRLSQSTESNSGKVTDENSESDSDTEEKLKAHSQRLVNVKSRLKQAPRYQSLERDLIEYQERQLFEYFVVVSLQKKQAGAAYVPELTQQFPLKLDRSFKFMREAEDQLKAIPQFCFPDAKDWVPVYQFTSETFSFVLTGEDGSRRFGYCRRLLPGGKGKRLPEVYCIVSRLGCFNLFSKILDEVEKRRGISPALVQPLMRSVMEAPFPALGKTITVKNFLPGSGTEVIELCRPLDSRLEHVDFESLFSSLSIRHLVCVFASLLLERRVIFIADKLSTLSKCCHAMVALIYPFTWQHTYIPVLPPSMIDIVCSPTPFLIGLLSSSLPLLKELPLEEVLVVDLVNNRFLRQMEDEESILPRKLQVALEHILEQRNNLASDQDEGPLDCKYGPEFSPLNEVVSEAFVRFFVEVVGHYSLFLTTSEREERTLQREAFRKAVSSKSLRRFLEVFMETQTFRGFIQERELRKQEAKGLFEVRAQEYLETLPSGEQSGVNKFLKGLGNKMKFLHKK